MKIMRWTVAVCVVAVSLFALPCAAAAGTEGADSSFHVFDYLALLGYLAIIVGIGVYFSKREHSTDDYFLAGRRVPWWAASLSIFSTMLSAVTFMAIPASAFATNWVSILVNVGILLATPVAVFCFLPFYRRLNVTSIYEYLELRFSPGVRIYGSLSFVMLQFAKMGVFLLLPALALATVTGLNVYACIIVMGLLCTIYTVMGGIEAVIWTDVLQSFVLLGGGLLCLGVIIAAEDFDFGAMMSVAVTDEVNKFQIFNWSGGIDTNVFWVVLIGGFFIQLVPFTSDQVIAQRFLTTKDEKSAANALWAHAGIVVPASLLFFSLGTALFVFYESRAAMLPSGDVANDSIVPWFIATQLPAGLAGLVIAGLFAATMSTVDSGMHSIATSLVTDVYRKMKPNMEDAQLLKIARILTIVAGILGTVSALLVSTQDPKSLWELILLLIAFFGSTLTGVFLLGVFTERASSGGVAVGIVASIASLIGMKLLVIFNLLGITAPDSLLNFYSTYVNIHGLLTAAVGVLSCVVVGYLASFIFPHKGNDLNNLTVGTLESVKE